MNLITGNITPLLIGTLGMIILAMALILFLVVHQRRVIRFQIKMQQMEAEQQQILLKASITLQEEERQRIAADLHDDAGPLLATARLYLTENLINLDKASQLQSIFNAKQIIDEAIQLIRNISHSLMPPTLKNFGLESAINDFFQKINASGSLNVNSRFNDYKVRLKPEKELTLFRVIQELVNNILKHSDASFIHLTQHNGEDNVIVRIHYDGRGLTQEDFLKLAKSAVGLGLKNIQSRLKVVQGDILFEQDLSESFYKITIDVPKEYDEK
jgi:two-component system NarL family sensor kinase